MQEQTDVRSEAAAAPPGILVQAEIDGELRRIGEHYGRLRHLAELEARALALGVKPHIPIDPKLLVLGRRLRAFFQPEELSRPDLSEERLSDVVRCKHGGLARRLLPLRLSVSRSAFSRGRRAAEAALLAQKEIAEAVEIGEARAHAPPEPRPRRKPVAPLESAEPPAPAVSETREPRETPAAGPPSAAAPGEGSGAPAASASPAAAASTGPPSAGAGPPPDGPDWPPKDGLLVAHFTAPPPLSDKTQACDTAAAQFLACMNLAQVSLEQTLSLWSLGESLSDIFAQRMTHSLCIFSSLSSDALAEFQEGAFRAREAEAQAEAQADVIAAFRAEQQAGLVVLGERERPEQHLTVGQLTDGSGRHVAISQSTPQVVVAMGCQDAGKTHLGANLADSSVKEGPGVSRLLQPGGVVSLHGSWHSKGGWPALLASLLANEDPEQQELLWRRYGDTPTRLERVRYLVFPGQEQAARKALAGLVRLGLRIDPILLDPAELDQFTFKVLLCGGETGLAGQQPLYISEIEELAQRRGSSLEIGKLREDILSSRMREQGKQMGLARLSLLSKLVRPGAGLRRMTERGVLTVVDVHGTWLGADLVMPVTLALMHQLSLGGDFHRWFLLDEVNKFTAGGGVDQYLLDLVREVRHRPVSLYLGAQSVRGLPAGLLSLATVVAMFQMQGKQEYRAAQEQVAGLLPVPFAEVARQRQGEAFVCASRATDRSLVGRAQQIAVRPLRCRSGGGSVRDR